MGHRRLMVGIGLTLFLGLAVGTAGLVGMIGCYVPPKPRVADPNTGQVAVRTDDPLSDQIAADVDLPYDRPALLAAMQELDLLEPNLGGYKFALLFVFQNQFDLDIAFDVWVNFQKIEPRQRVQAGRQEIFVVTNEMVEQTEAALRTAGAAAGDLNLANLANSRDLFGRPNPYIVQLRTFVASDDHVIADQHFLRAPLNAPPPDGTNLEPITKDTPPLRLRPCFETPAIIALVIEKTRVRSIELDREFVVPDYSFDPQEPADPAELRFPHAFALLWQPEQISVFGFFGRGFLLIPF